MVKVNSTKMKYVHHREIEYPNCDYCHKKVYPDEATARLAAKSVRKLHGPKLEAYRGPKCKKWHIGHPHRKPERVLKAKSRKTSTS